MKNKSRLTALLLAMVMLLSSTIGALADVIPLEEYTIRGHQDNVAAVLSADVPSGGKAHELNSSYTGLTEKLTIEGNEIDNSKPTQTVETGDEFNLEISWPIPTNITSNDLFIYAYPDELVLDGSFYEITGDVRAPIDGSETNVGYWTIQNDKLFVWFYNQDFLGYEDRNVTLTLSGTVDTSKLGDKDGEKYVDLQTKDPVVNVLTADGLTITKTGTKSINADNTASGSYTITVTAEKNLTNVQITDQLRTYYGSNVSFEYGYWPNSMHTYTGNGSVTRPQYDGAPYTISQMMAGETFTITYDANIIFENGNSGEVLVINEASAVSDQTVQVSDDERLTFALPEIAKTGRFAEAENAIYWTITVETNDFYDVKIDEQDSRSNQLNQVQSTDVVSVTKKSKNGNEQTLSDITFAMLNSGYMLDGEPGDVFTIELKSTLNEAAQGVVYNYVDITSPNMDNAYASVQIERSNLGYTAEKTGKLLPWTDRTSPVRTVEWTVEMEFTGTPALNFPYTDGTNLAYNTGAFVDELDYFNYRKMTLDRESIKLLDANGQDVTSQYLEVSPSLEDCNGFSGTTASNTNGYVVYFRFKKDAPEGKYTLKYEVDYDPTIYHERSYGEKNFDTSSSSLSDYHMGTDEGHYDDTKNNWISYKGSGGSYDSTYHYGYTDILLNYISKSGEVNGDTVTWYIPFAYDLRESDTIRIKDFWPAYNSRDIAKLDIEEASASLWYGTAPDPYYTAEATGNRVAELGMTITTESEGDYYGSPENTVGILDIPQMDIIGQYSDPAEEETSRSEYHYIKIEVPVSNYQNMTQNQSFTNKAQICVNGEWYRPRGGSVTVQAPAKITKAYTYTVAGAPDANYTIMVNEHRFKLLGEGETDLYVVDTMNQNLIYKNETLKIEEVESDGALTDVTSAMQVTYTAGEQNVLQIKGLEDETCYKITYEVLVNGAVGSNVSYTNTAELRKSPQDLIGTATQTLKSQVFPPVGVAGGRAPRYINVKKTDAKTGAPLAGAMFTLYTGYGTADQNAEITLTTNANGEFDDNWSPLPDTAYTLVETKAPDGYALDDPLVVARFGYFEKIAAPAGWTNLTNVLTIYDVTNEPSAKAGSLEITKTVVPKDANTDEPDEDQSFTFIVTFDDNNTYSYKKYDAEGNDITDPAATALTLKNGERAEFTEIPAGVTYTVVETPVTDFEITYAETGETESTTDGVGTIDAAGEDKVTVTNTYTKLKETTLSITKTVENAGDQVADQLNPSFGFEVTLEGFTGDYKYTIGTEDKTAAFTNGVATIQLKAGETALFDKIPVTTEYSVKEKTDNLPIGYTSVTSEQKGTVSVNAKGKAEPVALTFTNTYTTGSLKITKTVVGTYAPKDENENYTDSFKFTVNLYQADGKTALDGEYSYTIVNGEKTLDVGKKIANGGTLNLKDGDVVTIYGIPVGAAYTVTEEHEDYTTTSIGAEGAISTTESEAAFTNKYKYTELTIKKTGTASSDTNQTYLFTVASKQGTITVAIKGDSSATISGLEIGDNVKVKEIDGWSWRYTDEAGEDFVHSITLDDADNALTISNTRDNTKWLDGDSYKENIFGAVSKDAAPEDGN